MTSSSKTVNLWISNLLSGDLYTVFHSACMRSEVILVPSSVCLLFCASRSSFVACRWCWFSVAQLWWSVPESELKLQNREGTVAAASLLCMWRYAWLLQSINNFLTKCESGQEDQNGLEWHYCIEMTFNFKLKHKSEYCIWKKNNLYYH